MVCVPRLTPWDGWCRLGAPLKVVLQRGFQWLRQAPLVNRDRPAVLAFLSRHWSWETSLMSTRLCVPGVLSLVRLHCVDECSAAATG